jgi:hypothetical protein
MTQPKQPIYIKTQWLKFWQAYNSRLRVSAPRVYATKQELNGIGWALADGIKALTPSQEDQSKGSP